MTVANYIQRHGLWSTDESRLAEDLRRRVELEDLSLIRLAWADPHGAVRTKEVTVPVFLDVLDNGYNINVATTTLDGAGGRVFTSFVKGGGMGLDEMTGSPNLTIVPDPQTFRVLPWAKGVGWVLCNEYFDNGTPFHFSTRLLLKRQLKRLEERKLTHIIGLEIEWYLSRITQDHLTPENVGQPGIRGKPIETETIETAPIEPGYAYHSETNLDIMQPVLSELASVYQALGLPLRSIENEWGPGQVECTFTASDALQAADDYVLFRTATRQVCRRSGHFATFMCRPAFPGHYSSGWHLHQSVVDKTGKNMFIPENDEHFLSDFGQNFLAGLMVHAVSATIFATPTVNGYRRFQPNSLAPDRVSWGHDHRGTLMRILGGVDDAATRIENRAGEPAANPYLFIASQIAAGLDGIDNQTMLGPADDNPYEADRPLLPTNLGDALGALEKSQLFKDQFGDLFVDYYGKLKSAELNRFQDYLDDNALEDKPADVTQWEQNEYYDFF
ncbi:MAG: glutamine synthetase family protein [Rhodospirillales bacterium]|jgi:glutamine synthetase